MVDVPRMANKREIDTKLRSKEWNKECLLALRGAVYIGVAGHNWRENGYNQITIHLGLSK